MKPKTPTSERDYADKNDVLKDVISVHSPTQNMFSKDFTLCRLEAEHKNGVINMTDNAIVIEAFWQPFIDNDKAKKLTPEEQLIIVENRNHVIHLILNSVRGIAVLHRNLADNYLVDALTRPTTTDEQNTPISDTGEEDHQLITKLKKRFSKPVNG